LQAVGGATDPAFAAQQLGEVVTHVRVVVGDQQARRVGRQCPPALGARCRGSCRGAFLQACATQRRVARQACRRVPRRCRAPAAARQAQLEARSPARRAVHLDAAAHQLEQLLDQRQADAGAAVLAGGRVVQLLEALEQQRQLLGGDADAAVADRQLELVMLQGHGDQADAPAGGGEFERVTQQVEEDLLEMAVIQADLVEVADYLPAEGAAFLLGQLRGILEQWREHLAQAEVFLVQLELARFGLGEIQQVVDPVEQ